jgi:pimeloyl-ACP methyl ester carboxylesterase
VTQDGVENAFSGAEAVPPGWVERTEAMLALSGTLRTLVLEMRRFDRRALRPESLREPALVLHGSDDRDVPLAQGEDLHRRLAGSELVVVPDGSHMLPATHPELVAERIHRFAASLP